MQNHIKVVGWTYIILGMVGLLGAGLAALLIAGGGWISGDRTAIQITGLVAILVAGLIVLLSVPGIIAGAGLLKFKQWARILALILGLLNLPSFPVGTALGIYTIWVLLDDESIPLFT